MKRIYSTILTVFIAVSAMAQGWPANYGGVMLQGFSWDSYTESNWANLESQANELAEYFNIIWVPNSAHAGNLTMDMGYHPVYWFDHTSAFGTEAQLRSMIKTFKEKNVGVIEDVVINHRNGVKGWVDFPEETYKNVTYQLGLADICKDDECKSNGYMPTGNYDTGEPWTGARDLDHTSSNVQNNVNAYLDFLKNDLGYTGFRYDFVKGYKASYVGQYNVNAKPEFSVGECWDGYSVITNWIEGTKQNGAIQSAAFDFPMKWNINDAFYNGTWSKLNTETLARSTNYKRYGVTFIDNHDTFKDGNALKARIEAAHAYMLMMPGTPCVFLRHWVQYKNTIKKMIFLRKAAGITNMSSILTGDVTKDASNKDNGYILKVKGTNSDVLVVLGGAQTPSTTGMKLALEDEDGTYKIYVNNSLDISGLDKIIDEEEPFKAPDFCTPEEGKIYAFFEAPASWGLVYCWCWNGNMSFNDAKDFPGDKCKYVGVNNGCAVYKWVSSKETSEMPTGIIFANTSAGKDQTTDMRFKNGGYYTIDKCQGVVTGISNVIIEKPANDDNAYYTLSGVRVAKPTQTGIYIHNGKKVVLK